MNRPVLALAAINKKARSGPAAVRAAEAAAGDKEGKRLNTRLFVCLEFLGKHDSVNRAACLLISSAMAAQGKLLHSSIYC